MWLRGYGSVTIDGICEQAKIQKGSFYHFFRSKADVAAAALDAYWATIQPEMERIFSEPDVLPIQRIVNFFDSVYDRQLQRSKEGGQVMGCPLVTLGAEVIKHDSLVSAKARELMDRYCLYFEHALEEAQTSGEIPFSDASMKARRAICLFGRLPCPGQDPQRSRHSPAIVGRGAGQSRSRRQDDQKID